MFGLPGVPSFQLKWSPKEDITTYELAQCMSILIATHQLQRSGNLVKAVYESLPATAQRHFEVTQKA